MVGPGAVAVHSLAEALAVAGPGEVFVVGGGEIYRQTIGLASRLELTEIAASPQAEVFFPEVDDGWREVQRTPARASTSSPTSVNLTGSPRPKSTTLVYFEDS